MAVIGLGYVGLPLACEFADSGLNVVGIDVSEEKVTEVNAGRSYVLDIPSKRLNEYIEAGNLTATVDFSVIKDCEAVCICVPTPLRKSMDPDISFIVAAVDEIYNYLHKGLLIVLESTTYPGTTDEVVLSRLSESGMTVGEDYFLAFSPERVDPGNKQFTTRNTPKVLGGITPACTERATALYRHAVDTVVPVSSARAAEMVKLLENTFRAINIGWVNELAIMCDRLGLDVWEVIDAAKTKPFGFMPFYPGPGLGGHCIPIDPLYLSWKLKTINYTARFIELATSVNSNMPDYVVQKITDALNDVAKSIRGSAIHVLGVAYKRDVSDVRESPALDIMGLLKQRGAVLTYSDPYVPEVAIYDETYRSLPTDTDMGRFDCVAVLTDHSGIDYDAVLSKAKVVFDARNATAPLTLPESVKVWKL